MCDDEKVLVTAFKNEEEFVLVLVNNSAEKKSFSIPWCNKEILVSVTDENSNLKESTVSAENITLTPKSVTTVVIK
jgi:hypothetical protein